MKRAAVLCFFLIFECNSTLIRNSTTPQRMLSENGLVCNDEAATSYASYFRSMKQIYQKELIKDTCIPAQRRCGWPKEKTTNNLPLFVFAVGGEGSGHHLWQTLLTGVLDCVWQATDHYMGTPKGKVSPDNPNPDLNLAGFPHFSVQELAAGLGKQYKLRKNKEGVPCSQVFDAIDSFPYGIPRNRGRVFNHPDIINLLRLDGKLFNIKFLVLVRNTTDAALSALGRKFVQNVDEAVRTAEANMVYMEAALRAVPCHKTFVIYFEHAREKPEEYIRPLGDFLELPKGAQSVLHKKLMDLKKKAPGHRKKNYRFNFLAECKSLTDHGCFLKVWTDVNNFFTRRRYMWPTFSGNGYRVLDGPALKKAR